MISRTSFLLALISLGCQVGPPPDDAESPEDSASRDTDPVSDTDTVRDTDVDPDTDTPVDTDTADTAVVPPTCDVSACPVPANPCLEAACLPDGSCGEAPLEDGTVLVDDVLGDCLAAVCFAGQATSIPADGDVPANDRECMISACTAGLATESPVSPGQPCGTDLANVCSPSGECVECNSDLDCEVVDSDCALPSCDRATCVADPVTVGTLVGTDVAGDCKVTVCDGTGGRAEVADPTDPFVDGDACTQDVCIGTTPSNPPVPVGDPSTEICGDGIDQDCDGSDLACPVGAASAAPSTSAQAAPPSPI